MTEPWSHDALALADSLPDGVVAADAHGKVTLVSSTAAAMLSVSAAECIGKPLSEVLALEYAAAFDLPGESLHVDLAAR